jgi:ribosome-associated heat shock protein Hsp15
MSDTARVDAWLWAIRIYKTRTLATEACKAGHVKVNQAGAKPAQTIKPGDEVRVRIDGFDRILVVRQTISKRVSAPLAAAAVDERAARPGPPHRRARSGRRAPDQTRTPRDRSPARTRLTLDPTSRETRLMCDARDR